MDQRKRISSSIKACRLAAGWTQADLAEASGIPNTAISHFETARRLPSLENAIVLADALKVDLDSLVGRSVR